MFVQRHPHAHIPEGLQYFSRGGIRWWRELRRRVEPGARSAAEIVLSLLLFGAIASYLRKRGIAQLLLQIAGYEGAVDGHKGSAHAGTPLMLSQLPRSYSAL